jgi:hypothetical protein
MCLHSALASVQVGVFWLTTSLEPNWLTVNQKTPFPCAQGSETIKGMGKAGQALKQTLEKYGISQYKLAEVMGIERNNVSRWVREERDPTAEKVIEIIRGLKKINPLSAQEFVFLYAVDELEKKTIRDLLDRADIDDR